MCLACGIIHSQTCFRSWAEGCRHGEFLLFEPPPVRNQARCAACSSHSLPANSNNNWCTMHRACNSCECCSVQCRDVEYLVMLGLTVSCMLNVGVTLMLPANYAVQNNLHLATWLIHLQHISVPDCYALCSNRGFQTHIFRSCCMF